MPRRKIVNKRQPLNPEAVLDRLLKSGEALSAGALAQALGTSRQMAHRHLRGWVEKGVLLRRGKGRSTQYVAPAAANGRPFEFQRQGLDEDAVWKQLEATLSAVRDLPTAAASIARFAFTEMVNNAVDHSHGEHVRVWVAPTKTHVRFIVEDDGVGAFYELQRQRGFVTAIESLQELSKGKITTRPANHTGEGLFFSSRAVEYFDLQANGLRWTVDNLRHDVGVSEDVSANKGTRVTFDVALQTQQTLKEVFDAYSTEFEMTKTQLYIKLFEHGVEFVSRSEAKRMLEGLERYREIVLDFTGVKGVGQGFADEVFRVWSTAHAATVVTAVNMNPTVEFFVGRAKRSEG